MNERLVLQGIEVNLSRSAVQRIVDEGFSEEYGARPLRRTIQNEVEAPLADYILKLRSKITKKAKSKKKKIKVKKIRVSANKKELIFK